MAHKTKALNILMNVYNIKVINDNIEYIVHGSKNGLLFDLIYAPE